MKKQELILSKYPIQYKLAGNLNYAYLKVGRGEPIIFLHGFPDHAGTWDSVIEELSSSFTCIAPFLRGYYPTDIPDNKDYSMASIAEDIHLLVTQLGYSSYSVVGQDWGGSVAYVMANYFPKFINRVVSLNMPHPRFLKPSFKLLFKARHILYFSNTQKAVKRLSKDNYKYLDTLYKRWSIDFNFGHLKKQMVDCFLEKGRTEAALGYYWQLGKEDSKAKLKYKQLPTIPTLVLVGEKDGTVDLKQFKKMESQGGFKVKYHSSAGHFLQREAPHFCINEIRDFFKIKIKQNSTI